MYNTNTSFDLRKQKYVSTVKKNNFPSNYKTKQLINLRENQNQSKVVTIEKILPSRLLIELTSLSSIDFKIEMKSKYQTLAFPLSIKSFNDLKVQFSSDSINSKLANQDIMKASPLENDYIILKCSIINKNLVLVPPIRIFVPYNYPKNNPFVDLFQLDEFDDEMLPEYSIK